eukprot:467954_1
MDVQENSLTVVQAIINLCNSCIGVGILAKPFALAITGWYGLFSFVIAALLSIYAGLCLSNATLYIIKPIMDHRAKTKYNSIATGNGVPENVQTKESSHHTKSTFQFIAYKSMGKIGEIYSIVGFIILIETLLMNLIIMIYELIINITNSYMYVNGINIELIFLYSFIIYVPTSLILNWKQMTFISYIGVLSVISIFVSLLCVL